MTVGWCHAHNLLSITNSQKVGNDGSAKLFNSIAVIQLTNALICDCYHQEDVYSPDPLFVTGICNP